MAKDKSGGARQVTPLGHRDNEQHGKTGAHRNHRGPEGGCHACGHGQLADGEIQAKGRAGAEKKEKRTVHPGPAEMIQKSFRG